jgi:D-alanyl-D-alanine carboxypeptidase/D-alanyl-D-alanine-endopeptidase (penicillin-binding protein 4)
MMKRVKIDAMKKEQRFYNTLRIGLLSLVIFFSAGVSNLSSTPEAENTLQRLRKKIDAILATPALKGTSVGIQIISLDSQETIYERNPELTLNPASNTKLVTSAAALVRLTPQYQFRTSVYTDARIKKGVLEGNLYIKGGGDPTLSYQDLLALAQEVYYAGILTINGDIVGDDSFFDDEREFSGWHDFDRAYSGNLSALSLGDNSVHLLIKPSYRSGVAPEIILNPPTSYIQIKNKAVTLSSNGIYASFSNNQNTSEDSPVQETLVVQGKISQKSKYGVSAYVNVKNPSLFTTATFKDALQQIGIAVKGRATLGRLPKKPRRLAVSYSEYLSNIIYESNKSSSNFVAEQILKTLGAEAMGAPGTTVKGIQVIQEFLAEIGIPPEAYILENGSGLSRKNRLSANQIVTLLKYMHDSFEVKAEYLASLAIAGVDGTLRSRMQDTQAERRVRAKTGAIRSVSCLSGYAASQDNETFAFAILLNDYKAGTYDMRKIQNQIGLSLTAFYRQTSNASAIEKPRK